MPTYTTMSVVVCTLAVVLLNLISPCKGGSIATPSKHILRDGRVYSSTCFDHFKGFFDCDASSFVQIVACETVTSSEVFGLKAELGFYSQSSPDTSTSESNQHRTGLGGPVGQNTDVNAEAPKAEPKPSQYGLAASGRKAQRADNRARKHKLQTGDDLRERSKNAVKKASSSLRQNSKHSDELETQTDTDHTVQPVTSQSPGVFDQLERKVRADHGLECTDLPKEQTLGINECQKLLINKMCRASTPGVYSIVLKGLGNFEILATRRVGGQN